MPQYAQRSPIASISTPLGEDVLLLGSCRGMERVSGLFQFELELWSETPDIKADDIVGKAVTVTINPDEEGAAERYINGYVCSFVRALGGGLDLTAYRAQIVPWLWFLSIPVETRIYQGESQTIPDVIEKVFSNFGCKDFKNSLTGSYAVSDYCVQYQETPLDFLSRLMELAGIFYYFEHTETKHTLVLADANAGFAASDPAKVEARAGAPTGIDRQQRIQSWAHQYDWTVGSWTVSDAEPIKFFAGTNQTPADLLLKQSKAKSPLNTGPVTGLESYVFPGIHGTTADATTRATVFMEAEQAPAHLISASTTCTFLSAGQYFTLTDFPVEADNNHKFVVTSVTHNIEAEPYYRTLRTASSEEPEDYGYTNQITCIPFDTAYRPALVTPRPRVAGTLTAVVVGPSGEEIHTDKYGRIKVQFFWDREGKRDDSGVCWVRVAQSLAGPAWGGQFIPRIGQEVIVTFIGGDPDRPLVTGVVYNGENLPPFTLPDNKTQSGYKTRSSLKGEAENYNSLVFEDKKGEELITLHAEKDFERVVENNDTLKVGFEKKDEGSQTVEIHKDRTVTLETGSETLTIHKDRTTKLETGSETQTINKDRSVTVETGDDDLTVSQGNISISASAGKIAVTAAQEIKLTVGANSLKIDQSGVTVEGIAVKINGTATLDAKAPMATVSGDGTLTLKGGVIMIN